MFRCKFQEKLIIAEAVSNFRKSSNVFLIGENKRLQNELEELKGLNAKLALDNDTLRKRAAKFKLQMNSAYGRYQEWAKANPKPYADTDSLHTLPFKVGQLGSWQESPTVSPISPYGVVKAVGDLTPGDSVHYSLYHCVVEWVIEQPTGDYQVCLKHRTSSEMRGFIITVTKESTFELCNG